MSNVIDLRTRRPVNEPTETAPAVPTWTCPEWCDPDLCDGGNILTWANGRTARESRRHRAVIAATDGIYVNDPAGVTVCVVLERLDSVADIGDTFVYLSVGDEDIAIDAAAQAILIAGLTGALNPRPSAASPADDRAPSLAVTA